MADHTPQPRGSRTGFTCAICGKGVSRRRIQRGRRTVWVHHNPTGLIRHNGQVAEWGR